MAITVTREYTKWELGGGSAAVPVGTTRFAGVVLSTFTKCEQVMSDIWDDIRYAKIWDVTERRVRTVSLHDAEVATVDAPPAVIEMAARWDRAQAIKKYRRELRAINAKRVDAAVAEAMTVRKGRDVEVVKGRKVKIGTTGTAFWVGENRWGWSVGIELANGERVFSALSNVIVAQPDEFYEEPEQTDVVFAVRERFYSTAKAA